MFNSYCIFLSSDMDALMTQISDVLLDEIRNQFDQVDTRPGQGNRIFFKKGTQNSSKRNSFAVHVFFQNFTMEECSNKNILTRGAPHKSLQKPW